MKAATSDDTLAVNGGRPVRKKMLPYGKHTIDSADIRAVSRAMKSDWLTTGPMVGKFEKAFCSFTGSVHAVAVNSGTAALHCAMFAIGTKPGDEVIVPAITFAATANCVAYTGATPIFADVNESDLLINPDSVRRLISPRTKAVIAVDFAGQPCDYRSLRAITREHNLSLVSDACHSLGASYDGMRCGILADISAFSFHAVKVITTCEGGMVATDNAEFADRVRIFRNHGISSDFRKREASGTWKYEMVALGHNYRISDIQCALGINQLKRLASLTERRRRIARKYDAAFADMQWLEPLETDKNRTHARHIYVVKLNLDRIKVKRKEIFAALRAEGIGVNVHYIPVHMHPYYTDRYRTHAGLCPVAESTYERILTLPLFPAMTDRDTEDVIIAVKKVLFAYSK